MRVFKKIFKWLGLTILVIAVIAGILYLIYVRPFIQKMKTVTAVPIDKGLTVFLGGGGNSGLLSSDSLVIVIDTKMDEAAEALYAEAKKLAGNKPVLVINTHIHPDHTKGNELYKGATIMAGGRYSKEQWISEAHENTLPNEWLKETKTIRMNDDTLSIINMGRDVHTESDIMVYLHRRKLLFAGDVILNRQIPIIMGNGKAEGYLWAFDMISEKFDIQQVVPGHGPMGGPEVIANYRTYFNDMKTAATDNTQKGTLIDKYKNWGSIPWFMSPEATIRAFKKESKK